MALTWQFFPKKIAGIAPWLRASPPGPLTCHFVQNVIQMAIKLLFLFFFQKKISRIAQRLGASPPGPHSCNLFSRTQSSQPTTFQIVLQGF